MSIRQLGFTFLKLKGFTGWANLYVSIIRKDSGLLKYLFQNGLGGALLNPTKPRGFQVPESLTVILKELPGQNTEHLHFWKPVKQPFAIWSSFNMGSTEHCKERPWLEHRHPEVEGCSHSTGWLCFLAQELFYCLNKCWLSPSHKKQLGGYSCEQKWVIAFKLE